MAIQLLRALSSVRVVAVDVRDDALELARSAGRRCNCLGDWADTRSSCGPRSAPAAPRSCSIASPPTRRSTLAAGAVSIGGDICYVGRAGGSLGVNPGRLPFECSVMLPSWGTLPELIEVVALARSGAIHVEVER